MMVKSNDVEIRSRRSMAYQSDIRIYVLYDDGGSGEDLDQQTSLIVSNASAGFMTYALTSRYATCAPVR
jgi:hypothetical protein